MNASQATASFDETIGILAARWRGTAPLLPIFGLLARGRPLTTAEISGAIGVPVDVLEHRLAAVRCDRDEQGRLVDLFGMTLRQTSITLDIEGQTSYACCGLWAVMIPALVGRPAVIRSRDALTGDPVTLVATPDGIDRCDPAGTVATLATASARGIAADVEVGFCSHARYFASRDSAARFAGRYASRHVISLAALFTTGRVLLAAMTDAAAE